jgi:hypothetical protein
VSNKLKPCPSCGAKNTPECTLITELYDHDKYKYGKCFNCGIKIYDWNKRPIEDALQAHIAEMEEENLKIKTKEIKMNDTAYRIATSVMMDMLEAIEKKDREAFRKCLEDTRLHNAIIGNTAMSERYCALCVKALKVFV